MIYGRRYPPHRQGGVLVLIIDKKLVDDTPCILDITMICRILGSFPPSIMIRLNISFSSS